MALNQTLDRSASTVVVSGDTGARANGRDEVTITVTAKDTSAAVIPYAEVFIEETSGRHFISDAEMPQPPVSEGRLRGPDPIVTDANGVATVKVKSFYEGTLTFDVFVGAPQGGTGGAAGAGVFNGNNVDSGGVYTQKTLAADVGATGGYTTTYSSDQVIDAAWLTANNGGSTAIQDTRFQDCMVTVTTEVQFTNCLFEGGSNQYALLVNLPSVALSGDVPANYLLQDCTLTGGTEAALSGYRIHMIDCLVEECGKHGIQLTKRSGTGVEPVQVVRSVVRKVGSGGSTSAPQGYGVHVVDSGHVTFRGLSVECPYHTTGGAIAGYYPVGAVYVGADEEPITDFFFYTSWIDGGVLLDDAGLGIGPEGQMFSPNFFGRNYNPAVPLFDTTDVQSLWTKGQMWMDTGALVSNEEAGGNIRTFTGKKYNNLWASGAALDTQATFTLDTAYALVTLDAFDQFGPFNQNLLDQPPLNTSFGDWTPATINSSPVPTVLAETPLPFPQTGAADRISFNNSAAFADGALVRSRQVDVDAGFTAPYEVEVAAANGDGFKTVLSLKDSSDDLVEQTTVAFSNVFAEEHVVQSQKYAGATPTGSPGDYASFGLWGDGGGSLSQSAIQDPDGGYQAWTYTAASTPREVGANFSDTALASTFSLIALPDWDTGQSWTVSWYVHADSMVTSDYYRWRVQLWQSYSSAKESIFLSYYPSFPENPLNFTSSTSGGPGYTLAKNVRLEDAGNSWWKISVHIRDYSGLANRISWNPITSSGVGSYTIYKPEIRKGDHVSSQQLLTVDDGVENLAIDAGYGEFSDLTLSAGASIATSSIAAPDGTLTAVDVTSASAITLSQDILDTDFGAAWNDAATWTASWYVYTPSLSTNSDFVVALLNGATVQESATVTIDSDGDITSFTGVTQGAPSLSAERTIYAQSIGNTGWIKYEITLHDNGAASDRVRFIPISASSASNTYTLWSPELRYGDWVARGKNWATDNLSDYANSNYDLDASGLIAPDGTQSATTLTVNSGTFGYIDFGSGRGALIPTSAYIYYSFYFYTTDYSTSGSYPEIKAWHTLLIRTSSNTNREKCEAYLQMQEGSVAVVSVTSESSHTTYTASDVTLEQVDGRWWKCTLRVLDDSGLADNIYVGHAHGQGAVNIGKSMTLWNPRLTVGNPADARGYFVSGPQNLLGDGSDYSGWTAGTN